jgi:hypothetical protein
VAASLYRIRKMLFDCIESRIATGSSGNSV